MYHLHSLHSATGRGEREDRERVGGGRGANRDADREKDRARGRDSPIRSSSRSSGFESVIVHLRSEVDLVADDDRDSAPEEVRTDGSSTIHSSVILIFLLSDGLHTTYYLTLHYTTSSFFRCSVSSLIDTHFKMTDCCFRKNLKGLLDCTIPVYNCNIISRICQQFFLILQLKLKSTSLPMYLTKIESNHTAEIKN